MTVPKKLLLTGRVLEELLSQNARFGGGPFLRGPYWTARDGRVTDMSAIFHDGEQSWTSDLPDLYAVCFCKILPVNHATFNSLCFCETALTQSEIVGLIYPDELLDLAPSLLYWAGLEPLSR